MRGLPVMVIVFAILVGLDVAGAGWGLVARKPNSPASCMTVRLRFGSAGLQAPSVPATPGSLSSVSASAVISLSSRCSSKRAVIEATWAQEAALSRWAAGLGQVGVGDAEVGRAGFTFHEAFGLEPFEQAGDAGRCQKELPGDVDPLQPLTVGVGEDEEGFVVVDRESVLLEQLGAQQPRGAGGGTQQPGEGAHGGAGILAAVRARGCGLCGGHQEILALSIVMC